MNFHKVNTKEEFKKTLFPKLTVTSVSYLKFENDVYTDMLCNIEFENNEKQINKIFYYNANKKIFYKFINFDDFDDFDNYNFKIPYKIEQLTNKYLCNARIKVFEEKFFNWSSNAKNIACSLKK